MWQQSKQRRHISPLQGTQASAEHMAVSLVQWQKSARTHIDCCSRYCQVERILLGRRPGGGITCPLICACVCVSVCVSCVICATDVQKLEATEKLAELTAENAKLTALLVSEVQLSAL